MNIVCGGIEGWSGYAGHPILTDSCEVNFEGTSHWTLTQPLPVKLKGLRGVALDNRPLLLGGYDGEEYRDEIYELNTYTMEWNVVGHMEIPQNYHAVSVIRLEDYWPYCVNEKNYTKLEKPNSSATRDLPSFMLFLVGFLFIYAK